jgi:hypothetical protein
MAFERLRTIVITAVPRPRSARLPKPPRLPIVAKGRSPKSRIQEDIANGVLSRSVCPLIREIFHVVDDEHFMLPRAPAKRAGQTERQHQDDGEGKAGLTRELCFQDDLSFQIRSQAGHHPCKCTAAEDGRRRERCVPAGIEELVETLGWSERLRKNCNLRLRLSSGREN